MLSVISTLYSSGQYDKADLVIILSNLFNNAIEACELLSENKTIEIKIKSINDLLFISFANPVCKSTIDTSKTNKHNKFKHGYGIQNIRRVVDSYNGNTNIDISDGIYTISVMLHLR